MFFIVSMAIFALLLSLICGAHSYPQSRKKESATVLQKDKSAPLYSSNALHVLCAASSIVSGWAAMMFFLRAAYPGHTIALQHVLVVVHESSLPQIDVSLAWTLFTVIPLIAGLLIARSLQQPRAEILKMPVA